MTRFQSVLAVCTLFTFACSGNDDGGAPSSSWDNASIGGAATSGAPSTGGAADTGGTPSTAGASPSAGAASAGAPGASGAPSTRTRCTAPAGLSAAPGTIAEAVQWLNALPKPTTAACFLESLPRPLAIVATNSQFSAQPALSAASPRVFIEIGRLWVSAVIDGESSYLLEFGERLPDSEFDTLKGEIELPLSDVISANAPYERVRFGSGTTCGLCHRNEQRSAELSVESFVSAAIRPRPDTHVSLEALRAQHAACDWAVNSHRCEMLASIFDGGAVVETAFPEMMPTFF
jgi:hypothetical protein